MGKALYTDSNTISLTPSANNQYSTILRTSVPSRRGKLHVPAADPTAYIHPHSAPPASNSSSTSQPRRLPVLRRKTSSSRAWTSTSTAGTMHLSTSIWPTSSPPTDIARAATFTNSSPSTNGPTYYHERFLVGGWTTQIGSASVNEVHGQWGAILKRRARMPLVRP